MIICCTLMDIPMNSKLLEFFIYHPNLPLKNIFFQVSFGNLMAPEAGNQGEGGLKLAPPVHDRRVKTLVQLEFKKCTQYGLLNPIPTRHG